ncbi:hypothetical protein WDU94_005220 [Cyamophila willieti]
MLEMKVEFETFMDKVCVENKKLEESMQEKEEKACLAISKLKKQNKDHKKHIEDLEEEIIGCRRQIANFLTSLDPEKYKKTIQEKDLEICRGEKKIEALTDRMKNLKETHGCLLEENENLRESLERVKLVVNRAKLDIIEYCREIKKYDDMTVAMEKQISQYQSCLLKMQEQVKKNTIEKTKLKEQIEALKIKLSEEKTVHAGLEKDLMETKAKSKLAIKNMKECQKKLNECSRELNGYKDNLSCLRKKFEVKRKRKSQLKVEGLSQHEIKVKKFNSCGDIVMACCGKPMLKECKTQSNMLGDNKTKNHSPDTYLIASLGTVKQLKSQGKLKKKSYITKLNSPNSRFSSFFWKKMSVDRVQQKLKKQFS